MPSKDRVWIQKQSVSLRRGTKTKNELRYFAIAANSTGPFEMWASCLADGVPPSAAVRCAQGILHAQVIKLRPLAVPSKS